MNRMLIHADSKGNDIEDVKSFSLDMAFGSEENDFELETSLGALNCSASDILYINDTEIGGIIDVIKPSTKSDSIIYKGRTAHGILDSYIICPPAGYSAYEISGDVESALKSLIKDCNVSNVDVVECDDISITATSTKYVGIYTALTKILYQNNAKLKIRWHNGRIQLSAVYLTNYSTNEQFDSSKIKFEVEKFYNLPNHFICVGKDANENERVIHLFTLEGGDVLPYTTANDPKKDKDYILDTRMIAKLDKPEYSTVIENDNSGTKENYEILLTKPSDWDSNYPDYYTQEISEEDGSVSYSNIERNTGDWYELLQDKPTDWDSNYTNYYTREYDPETGEYTYSQVDADDKDVYDKLTTEPADWYSYYTNYFYLKNVAKNEYAQIEKVTKDTYTAVKKKPKDWNKKYANYYTNNGTGKLSDVNDPNLNNNKTYGEGWSKVSAGSKTVYKPLTTKPSDWKQNWPDYYVYSTNGIYIKYRALFPYEYASLKSRKKTLKFEKNKFYYQTSKETPPSFSGLGTVYSKKTTEDHPSFSEYSSKIGVYTYTLTKAKEFVRGGFYRKVEDHDFGFPFVANSFYKMVYDNYSALVEDALEKIAETYSKDSTDLDLSELEAGYDINDVIGIIEHQTGVVVNAPIKKKIITIEKNQVSTSYEI